MKESLKISKSFVCGCGREYSLEISTDLAVDNMQIEVSCPSCGEKRTVSMGSLLQNKGPGAQAPAQANSQSQSSSDSVPSLSFMDSMEAPAASSENQGTASSPESSESKEPSSSYDSSGASDTLTSMEDEGDSVYTDMFGDG